MASKNKTRRPSRRTGGGSRRVGTAAKRRAKAAKQKWLMISAMIMVPVGLLGAGVFTLTGEMSKVYIDTVTFCYDDQPDQYHAAFATDYSVTDFASPDQIRGLKNAYEQAYDDLPPNGRIDWFSSASDTNSSIVKPNYYLCKPPSTPQQAEAVGITSKLATSHQKDVDDAKEAYMVEVDKLIASRSEKAAKSSALFEMVLGIGDYYERGRNLEKLFFYTDGIQTSSIASFCQVRGELPPWNRFKQTDTYELVKLDDRLSGVDVDLLLVEWVPLPSVGLEHCTHQEVRAFWPSWFKDGKADVKLKRLEFGVDQASVMGGLGKASVGDSNNAAASGSSNDRYDCGKCHTDMRSEVVLLANLVVFV